MRGMLAEWDKVRAAIISGRIDGLHAAMHSPDGGETICSGGVYADDPQAAMRAFIKSTLISLDDAPAPRFGSSRL